MICRSHCLQIKRGALLQRPHLLLAATLMVIVALCVFPGPSSAQKYPEKPIRFVVPVAPGGSADQLARMIGVRLGELLGQTVTVDNRPGANGIIGADIVARAAPDGYTILFGALPTLAINPTLYAGKVPYNAEKDFAAIAMIARIVPVLAIHPSVPAKNLKAFIALAKAQPGKLNFGSSGMGSGNHLVGELLKTVAGIDIVHIPYGGGAPALVALLSGQIEAMITPPPTLMPMIKSGRVRAIAVSSAKRLAALPDVPTIAESGFPGFDATSWYCIAAPAATPKPVIDRLHGALMTVLNSPEYRQRLELEGMTADVSTPEAAAAFVRSEVPRWARVIKAAGVKVQ